MNRISTPAGLKLLSISALTALATVGLVGCSTANPAAEKNSASAEATTHEHADDELALIDGWAKAGEGMTGVFGTLENHGDHPITLTSVDSDAAGMIELHETITSGSSATMRPVEGGFEIPAGGSFTFEPGGNHIMFMDMPVPLVAGDEVQLTLRFDDGSVTPVTVIVKDFAGAQENYEGGSTDDHAGHGSSDDHADDGSSDEHSGH